MDTALDLARKFKEEHPTVDVFPLDGKIPKKGVMWQRPRDIDDYDWEGVTSYGIIPKGYTVIDIDSAEAAKAFEAQYGETPETLVIKSPHGAHIWLSGESEHRNALLTNVDIRSGHKGYIVGPGSIVNGMPYQVWLNQPIAPLPESWYNAISTPKAPMQIVTDGGSFQEMANAVGYNNALQSLKGKLVKLGVDEEIANEMVRTANRSLENPYPEAKLESTVLAKKNYVLGSFDLEAIRPEGGRLTTSRERRTRPPIQWLVNDLFPDFGVAQVVAPSMAGKSFAMIDLALRIVNGYDSWIGRPLAGGGSVVYVMSEGSLGFQRRLDAWMAAHPGSDDSKLYDLNAEEFYVDLATADGVTELAQDIVDAEIHDLKLVIIDTQGQLLASMDENSNSEFNQAIATLKRLAKKAGALIILVHHSGHEGGRGRGASAMLQAMDAAVSLKLNGQVEITKVKEAERGGGGLFELVPSGDSVMFEWVGANLAEVANNDRDNLTIFEPNPQQLEIYALADSDTSLSYRELAELASFDVSHTTVGNWIRARRVQMEMDAMVVHSDPDE